MSECTHSYGWCSRCGQYVDGPALLAARDARIAELEAEVSREQQARRSYAKLVKESGDEIAGLSDRVAQLTRERDEAGADTAEVIAMSESNAAKSHAAGFAACREMVQRLAHAHGDEGSPVGSEDPEWRNGFHNGWMAAAHQIGAEVADLKSQGGNDGEVG